MCFLYCWWILQGLHKDYLYLSLRGSHLPKLRCVFKLCSRSILCTKSLHNTIQNLVASEIWYPANADGLLAAPWKQQPEIRWHLLPLSRTASFCLSILILPKLTINSSNIVLAAFKKIIDKHDDNLGCFNVLNGIYLNFELPLHRDPTCFLGCKEH